jgi:hypothetical protein
MAASVPIAFDRPLAHPADSSPRALPRREEVGPAALTRRRLLQLGALVAIVGAPRLAGVPASAIRDAGAVHQTLRRSTYAPLVGRRFRIHGRGGAAVGATLVEIRDLRRAGDGLGAGEAFALLFHGPRSPRLEQGMYELRRPEVANPMPVLMTPSGTGRRGQDYEVVINRRRALRG